MRKMIPVRKPTDSGYIMAAVLSLLLAASIFATALLMLIITNFHVVGTNIQSQKAFNIAEAGVNYYLWHMAHNNGDFKDGQSTPTTPDAKLGYGPYVHTYTDADANNIGTFTLWIKPQGNGSTIATVRSIGKANGEISSRTVEAQVGATSFASYGLVSDQEFWFGSNESANGPVFSNVGIHMDGPSSDVAASANSTYVPQSQYGGNGSAKNGVWCSTTVTIPVNCATRDKTNWLYPRSTVDFNLVSSSLCSIKKIALNNFAATACSLTPTTRTSGYIPQTNTSGSFSTNQGYLIQLNTNGTYDLYKVSSENDKATSYSTALSTTAVATNISVPTTGNVFVEDNVWIRTNPTYHGRVTIASGRLASSTYQTSITIADNLLYTAKNGSDSIGLIAQKDVVVAAYAPPASGAFTFEVDAAALAQNGSVTWPEYYEGTTQCTKGWVASNQNFVYYGSVATRLNWTWNYSKGACGSNVKDPSSSYYISGIMRTQTNYDYNLLYAPPPSYPVTGSYNILGWREVLTKP